MQNTTPTWNGHYDSTRLAWGLWDAANALACIDDDVCPTCRHPLGACGHWTREQIAVGSFVWHEWVVAPHPEQPVTHFAALARHSRLAS